MADYKVVWKRSAVKELENLPAGMAGKIVSNVEQLAENPFPAGTKKLVGSENLYRIRVGDYRVIYDIHRKQLIIQIVRVGHRKDVYR